MTSRWSVGGMAAALVWSLAGGCGGEDGILIEVTRDDSVPASIARLAFHVGVDAVPGYPSRFVDVDPDEEVILDGRDIADDPYRLLIRPREHPGAQLMVAVVAYRRQEVLGFGALDQPVRFVDGEVAMWRIVLTRRLPDGFATSEIGCLIWTNGRGDQVAVGQGADQDCDGWASGDCNDLDPSVNPGAGEICGNAADEDCDGVTDENVDEDGDLVTTCDGDCNDAEPAVNPDATEECDGVDNDCNGLCDEGLDADGDAYTVCGSKLVDGGAFCLFDARLADCDDGAGSINPGAAEVCDGVDNDCDGACDNRDAGLDRDGDGFTACGSLADHCGASELYVDCEDEKDSVHPGAPELCNGTDDDCDGHPLQRGPCFALDPGTSSCFFGERDCADDPGGPGDWQGDCQPLVDAINLAPDAVCATYAGCDQADDPDPYTCSIVSEQSGLAITACDVSYRFATGEQCPGSELVLPTGGQVDCTWTVVGGVDQDDYRIGLRDINVPDATPQAFLPLCDAVLVVTVRDPGAPSPHHVLLARTDPLLPETVYFALSLDSRPADDCGPPAGLECQDLVLP